MNKLEHEEQKNGLVSIVVPVYNVEKYLDKCICSLLEQTYSHVEIILVDDGSTDSSAEICRKHESADPRVRVFQKANGGLSSARNAGIHEAKGQFITFIDSDDYVSKYYVEVLLQNMEKDCISIVNHQRVQEGSTEKAVESMADVARNADKNEVFKLFLLDNNLVSAWGKLFPLSYFDTVSFPEGKIYEDFSTVYKLYDQAEKFILHDSELYYYLMRNSSITNSTFSKKNLDLMSACDEVEAFIYSKGLSELEDYFLDRKIRSYLVLANKLMQSGCEKEYAEEMDKLNAYLKGQKLSVLLKKSVTLKTKLAFFTYRLSPKLFARLLKR